MTKSDFSSLKNVSFPVIKNSIECPEPVPLAIVVGAIVGSIVTLGLIVLAMLKGIIMFIQWREYKKFIENLGQQQWGQVRTFRDIQSNTEIADFFYNF